MLGGLLCRKCCCSFLFLHGHPWSGLKVLVDLGDVLHDALPVWSVCVHQLINVLWGTNTHTHTHGCTHTQMHTHTYTIIILSVQWRSWNTLDAYRIFEWHEFKAYINNKY